MNDFERMTSRYLGQPNPKRVTDERISDLDSHADEITSSLGEQELRNKLQSLVAPSQTNTMSASPAYVVETFPFENCFIFNKDGKLYRQKYNLAENGDVTLAGEVEEVKTAYVPVG
jgi:hypothetical protein